MANILAKFDIAERAELLTSNLYQLLANKFSNIAGVRQIFRHLEQEEYQHALRVRILKKQYLAETLKVTNIPIEIDQLKIFIQQGTMLKKDFESGEKNFTFDQALQKMSKLENNFAITHAGAMMSAADKDLQNFFKQLSDQDRMHTTLLNKFYLQMNFI